MEALIPDKVFFKIGEVAQITSLRPSVLRYWETEFQVLRPKKSRSGQRLYTKDDLELIHEIKKLLYCDKLTIAGAKKRLGTNLQRRESGNEDVTHFPDHILKLIKEVEVELRIIRNSL